MVKSTVRYKEAEITSEMTRIEMLVSFAEEKIKSSRRLSKRTCW
jgi:hypothetical protein